MKKNIIYQLINALSIICLILDDTYLNKAKQATKLPKPLKWFDGKKQFEVRVINTGSRKKPAYKLRVLCDEKVVSKYNIKLSQKRIIDQLIRKKEELKKGTSACDEIIIRADKFRYCYFWEGDNGNSNSRRYYENQWSFPTTCWNDGENEWSVSYSVSQSRKNTYATGYYYKNGVITNLTAIKHQRILLGKLIVTIDNALGLEEKDSQNVETEIIHI